MGSALIRWSVWFAVPASCRWATRPRGHSPGYGSECRKLGHSLHQKHHVGDLWIAATAVRWKLPLVAHDVVFFDCPKLDLRTELTSSR